jgi:hypothetical protein
MILARYSAILTSLMYITALLWKPSRETSQIPIQNNRLLMKRTITVTTVILWKTAKKDSFL